MATNISAETRAAIRAAWPDFLARVAAGELIKDACTAHGFSVGEMRVYRTSEPGAQAQWDAAREESADAFVEEAMEVARTSNSTQVQAADARTRIDTLKWAARVRNPRAYSDKQTIDMNVRTVDLTRVIADARKRLEASRVIEGAVIRPAVAHRTEPHITSESVPALSDLL